MIERCVFFFEQSWQFFRENIIHPFEFFLVQNTFIIQKLHFKTTKEKKFKARKERGLFIVLKVFVFLFFFFSHWHSCLVFSPLYKSSLWEKRPTNKRRRPYSHPTQSYVNVGEDPQSPHIPVKIQGLCILVEIFRGKIYTISVGSSYFQW